MVVTDGVTLYDFKLNKVAHSAQPNAPPPERLAPSALPSHSQLLGCARAPLPCGDGQVWAGVRGVSLQILW